MPVDRSQIAVLTFAGVMLAAASAARLGRPLQHSEVERRPVTYLIEVNQADHDTLCLLPSIGPGIASRIIRHRTAGGPFHDAADLETVSGIGPKTRAAVTPWVDFEVED